MKKVIIILVLFLMQFTSLLGQNPIKIEVITVSEKETLINSFTQETNRVPYKSLEDYYLLYFDNTVFLDYFEGTTFIRGVIENNKVEAILYVEGDIKLVFWLMPDPEKGYFVLYETNLKKEQKFKIKENEIKKFVTETWKEIKK